MLWQGVARRSTYLTGQRFWETYNFNEWQKEAWSQERYDAGLPITYSRLAPGSNASKQPPDIWYAEGTYIRLRNAECVDTLPSQFSGKLGAFQIRIHANGLTLFKHAKYAAK